jgi:hypothetical protein
MTALAGRKLNEKMSKLFYLRGNEPRTESDNLVTGQDLEHFRVKLLMDIKIMLEGHLTKAPKRWLKSYEVKKMMGISAGTLQTMRNNGKIPFTKIGGLTYYDASEIDQLLGNKKRS